MTYWRPSGTLAVFVCALCSCLGCPGEDCDHSPCNDYAEFYLTQVEDSPFSFSPEMMNDTEMPTIHVEVDWDFGDEFPDCASASSEFTVKDIHLQNSDGAVTAPTVSINAGNRCPGLSDWRFTMIEPEGWTGGWGGFEDYSQEVRYEVDLRQIAGEQTIELWYGASLWYEVPWQSS